MLNIQQQRQQFNPNFQQQTLYTNPSNLYSYTQFSSQSNDIFQTFLQQFVFYATQPFTQNLPNNKTFTILPLTRKFKIQRNQTTISRTTN